MSGYTTPATAGELTAPKLGAKLDDLGIVFPIELMGDQDAVIAAIRAGVEGGDPWEAAFGALTPERHSQKRIANAQRAHRQLGHDAGRLDPAAIEHPAVAAGIVETQAELDSLEADAARIRSLPGYRWAEEDAITTLIRAISSPYAGRLDGNP